MTVSRPLLSASCLCVLLACKPEPATQAPEPTAPPVATTDPTPLDPGTITDPQPEPPPGATGEPPAIEPAEPPVATTNPPAEPTPVATTTSDPLTDLIGWYDVYVALNGSGPGQFLCSLATARYLQRKIGRAHV